MPKLITFRKELLSNKILIGGKHVPFQPLANNRGVICLDEEKPEDAEFIAALKDFAARRKYGVIGISAEEYEGLKKNIMTSLPRSKREKLKVMQPLLKPKPQSPVKAAPDVKPPITPTAPVVPTNPTATILQQTTQNPDGSPGEPVNIAVGAAGAKAPAFVPRTAAKPEVAEAGKQSSTK